jgi:hypothetical protein
MEPGRRIDMQFWSNVLLALGSAGMFYYAVKFPFSTHLWELKDDPKAYKFLGILNGYYFWLASWFLILLGSVIPLIAYLPK